MTHLTRSLPVVAVALVLGPLSCGSDPSGSDAGSDGGDQDAGRDAAVGPGVDAGDEPTDAAVEPEPDAGLPCSVDGVPGECIDVALCTDGRHPTPGHCPGPAEIQCCTADEPGACDPDAHPLPNEGLVEAPGDGGCPDGMTAVEDFCIDRWEAALERVDPGAGEPTSWSPFWNPGDEAVRAVSIEGAIPQGYISGLQAGAACAAAGKRLCTDDEWLRACQGPDGNAYPYGDARQPGVCNDARATHPAIEYFGTADAWIWSELDHPCLDQLPDSLDAAGANPGCISADGAYDMMGNLHEWTADPAGTFRGGYFVDTVINGDGCLYRTTAHDSSHWDYSTGFRCCAD